QGADLVVKDLRGSARQRAETGRLELRQELRDRLAKRRRALGHFERREGMDVHAWHRRLDGAADARIGVTGIVRMDAALQAYLGGAAIPRLRGAAHDLLQREVIGRAAQSVVRLAFGEGTEPAAKVADVGVV